MLLVDLCELFGVDNFVYGCWGNYDVVVCLLYVDCLVCGMVLVVVLLVYWLYFFDFEIGKWVG